MFVRKGFMDAGSMKAWKQATGVLGKILLTSSLHGISPQGHESMDSLKTTNQMKVGGAAPQKA
jgi:uncharacterized membrane protein YdcZ (DUF606 family)